MKLEDQVCTLEQAERLQELGVNKACFFVHIYSERTGHQIVLNRHYGNQSRLSPYPAYTVAELGEMLPVSARAADGSINLIKTGKLMGHYTCIWEYQHSEIHPTEAQARAAMLIHLLENGIISQPKTQTA